MQHVRNEPVVEYTEERLEGTDLTPDGLVASTRAAIRMEATIPGRKLMVSHCSNDAIQTG